MKQLMISVGREFGSGGHEIANRLSEIYNLPFYDRNLLKELAEKRNMNSEGLEKYDEVRKNKLFHRTVNGMSSSPEQNIAELQFDYLRKKASLGDSFVIVGRCSETILKGYEGIISIFILGDMDKKIERIMKLYNMNNKEAEDFIKEKDRKRKKYHNSYSKIKWGDSRNYDISINSSKLGIDGTINIISKYIDAKIGL